MACRRGMGKKCEREEGKWRGSEVKSSHQEEGIKERPSEVCRLHLSRR